MKTPKCIYGIDSVTSITVPYKSIWEISFEKLKKVMKKYIPKEF